MEKQRGGCLKMTKQGHKRQSLSIFLAESTFVLRFILLLAKCRDNRLCIFCITCSSQRTDGHTINPDKAVLLHIRTSVYPDAANFYQLAVLILFQRQVCRLYGTAGFYVSRLR